MKLAKKVFNRLNYPGEFFRYGNVSKREVYHKLSRLVRYKTVRKRILLGNSLQNERVNIDDVPEELGYKICSPYIVPEIKTIVEYARSVISETNIEELSKNAHKNYLINLPIPNTPSLDSPLMKLALEPSVLAIVSSYMGMLPILSEIQIWHSPNVNIQDGGSQFFHLDYADVRQAKVFLMIDDVDDETGPLTIVPAHLSSCICKKINYKLSNSTIRVDDEIIMDIAGKENILPIKGPSGTMAFVDTCRCFHYGSRKGTKPRNILMIQYLSPFSFIFPWDWTKKARFASLAKESSSVLIRNVLGAE